MHADLGSTMLTPLHTAGWCLVDFFKPANFLVIQGTRKKRGGARLLGGGAFIRDNTVYTLLRSNRARHIRFILFYYRIRVIIFELNLCSNTKRDTVVLKRCRYVFCNTAQNIKY